MQVATFSFGGAMSFFKDKFCNYDCSFSLAENDNEKTENLVNILGFKAKFLRIQEKIDHFNKLGAKGIDLLAALSPKNTGEISNYYQIGRVDFIVRNPNLIGQIEYLSEMKGSVLFREVTLASFRRNNKSMYEISYDWGNAAGLHRRSLLEFIKNPQEFMKTRF